MKNNTSSKESEFGPEQQPDINAVLSVVEDIIKQNNKTHETLQSKTQNLYQSQAPSAYVPTVDSEYSDISSLNVFIGFSPRTVQSEVDLESWSPVTFPSKHVLYSVLKVFFQYYFKVG